MQKISDAFAFLVFFFTEAVPMMLNASLGAIGDLLDAIGYAKTIIGVIAIIAYIMIHKISNE